MNQNIIDQFNLLINKLNDNLKNIKDKKEINQLTFKIKQFKNVIKVIYDLPFKITKENYEDLINYDGIGKGTITRIEQILNNKKLDELDEKDVKEYSKEIKKNKLIEELSKIIGIGNITAKELIEEHAIKSVEDFIKKVNENKIVINDKIKLGLKYYGKVEDKIPRTEIDLINKFLIKKFNELNKKLSTNYFFEIAGSYRRGKSFSGDIDVLVSKKDKKSENDLLIIVQMLEKPSKKNNNKPFLLDNLTDYGETKYMGFAQYKDNPIRRIDIRFVPIEFFPSALLYFTGSMELNKKMRQIAKKKGLKLNEYGLQDKEGNYLEIKSEKEYFEKLDLEYLEPKYR